MQMTHALPAELTIYTVGELAPQLAGWLPDASSSLQVDASRVTEVDTAGLQLLIALSQHCRRQGHRLALLNAARPLVQAAHSLGLQPLLGPDLGDTP